MVGTTNHDENNPPKDANSCETENNAVLHSRQKRKQMPAYLQTQVALHKVDRGLQDFPPLRRDELCERLGVEARVREAEAAVHGVGRQLDRALPDLQLLPLDGIALAADQVLDRAPALHQATDDAREQRGVVAWLRQCSHATVLQGDA